MTAPAKGSSRVIGEGKYELLSPVGLGAMGIVYLARHVALDRVVAVKLLNSGLTARPEAAERFLREARAASLLRHKNTVHVLDFGGDQATGFFLVMEYVEGRNLAEVLAEEGTIEPGRAIRIGGQLLAALAEAHEFEIVHRDIKPANVMLVPWTDDDGHETELVKVLDFGIATMRSEPRFHMREEVAGTPEYMSPEQAQGMEVDARSDVYAVATLLYAMICGEVPFSRESAMETMVAQVSTAPRPPRTLAPHMSEGLERILLKALSKRPDDRFVNARAFRTALLELPECQTGDLPIVASVPPTRPALPPVDVPPPAPAASSRRRGLLLALLAVAAAALLVAWVAGAFEAPGPGELALEPAGARAPAVRPPEAVKPAQVAEPAKVAPSTAPTPEPTQPPGPKPAEVARVEPPTPSPTELAPVPPMPAPAELAPILPTTPPTTPPKVEPPKVDGPTARPPAPEPPGPTSPKPPGPTSPKPPGPTSPPTVTAPTGPAAVPAKVEPTSPEPPQVAALEPAKVEPPKVEPVNVEPPKVVPRKALAAAASIGGLAVEGSLPRSSVGRALDGALGALEQCYRTAAVAANDDASAGAAVHLEIDIDGRARNVAVGALPLPGLQACAAGAIGRVRTKDRPDTGTVGASFRLTFTPRTAP